MNTGIGAKLLLKFVGFRAVDRPGIRGHFVQSVQIVCCARRPGVLSVTHTPGTKERCAIELHEETARHILRVLLCEVRERLNAALLSRMDFGRVPGRMRIAAFVEGLPRLGQRETFRR